MLYYPTLLRFLQRYLNSLYADDTHLYLSFVPEFYLETNNKLNRDLDSIWKKQKYFI